MKSVFATFVAITWAAATYVLAQSPNCLACPGNVAWIKRAGGGGQDGATAIAVDSAGNCYVTGAASSEVDFDGTILVGNSQEIFLAKYDSAGTLIWVREPSATGSEDAGRSVALD